MRTPLWGAALLLLSACKYEVAGSAPDASGPFIGDVSLIWAPTSFAVTANFTMPQFAMTSCPGTQLGNCCTYDQPQIVISTGGVEPITVSAGTLTVSDGAQPLASFDFANIGYYPLSSAVTPSLLWKPGDTLSVFAEGAQVDGFSDSITAPPAFTGVSPVLTLTDQVIVYVTQDFSIVWIPGPTADAGGNVTVDIFDPVGFYIECTGPDSAGTLTVPAAAFGAFLPGDYGYVTLLRTSIETLTNANATVTLTAQASDVGVAAFQ
jgi:hypothetical protein